MIIDPLYLTLHKYLWAVEAVTFSTNTRGPQWMNPNDFG